VIDPLLIFCVGIACLSIGGLAERWAANRDRQRHEQTKTISYPGLYLVWSRDASKRKN